MPDKLAALARRYSPLLLAAALIVGAGLVSRAGEDDAGARTLEFNSVYSNILLVVENDFVTFQHTRRGARMAVVDLENPARQVLRYSPYLFAGELVRPSPTRVLNIGLGGGSFNHAAAALYPDAELTTIEIDPVFLDLAIEYARFEETERNRVEISDGRRWLSRSEGSWDWIILDAYNKDVQIPFHLTTVEFYEEVAERLAPGGAAVANLHSTNARLYTRMVATIAEVFPTVRVFPVPGAGNVIAIMSNDEPAAVDAAIAAWWNEDLAARGAPLNIDFETIRAQAEEPRVSARARRLTDDFAPVEFLQGG